MKGQNDLDKLDYRAAVEEFQLAAFEIAFLRDTHKSDRVAMLKQIHAIALSLRGVAEYYHSLV